jgi:hypothetical protein
VCPYINKWKCKLCNLKDNDLVIVEACGRDGHSEHELDMPIRIKFVRSKISKPKHADVPELAAGDR